jgi:CRP-like cAMP-binding protein
MFGELGILLNKPRAASIVAKTNTHVAVMLSEHYKAILK